MMAAVTFEVLDPEIALVTLNRPEVLNADLSGTGEAWTKPSRRALKTAYDAQVRLADQMTRLYELQVPVIAAINGAAVGGGLPTRSIVMRA